MRQSNRSLDNSPAGSMFALVQSSLEQCLIRERFGSCDSTEIIAVSRPRPSRSLESTMRVGVDTFCTLQSALQSSTQLVFLWTTTPNEDLASSTRDKMIWTYIHWIGRQPKIFMLILKQCVMQIVKKRFGSGQFSLQWARSCGLHACAFCSPIQSEHQNAAQTKTAGYLKGPVGIYVTWLSLVDLQAAA